MVNIIIPTYKARDTLPKALDSLVAQTKTMFIVTIVQDCDGEDYSDIIKEYFDGLHGGLLPSEYSSIQSIYAKMVYNRGEWSTFRLSGEYWVAVDCIVVSAPSTKYDIHFISDFDNKDQVGETSPERFRTWNNYKIPFRGGDQILDITLPSCAIVG